MVFSCAYVCTSTKKRSPSSDRNNCEMRRKNSSAAKLKSVAEMRSRLITATNSGITGGGGVAVHRGSRGSPNETSSRTCHRLVGRHRTPSRPHYLVVVSA